ncbi:MAG: TonB-dependent receptor [Woeseiaceae bacterium]
MKYKPLTMMILLALPSLGNAEDAVNQTEENAKLGEIVVEGKTTIKPSADTPYTSPSTSITKDEVEGINAVTIDDFIKYEPSMVVRRRYIGDPNGTVGIRGSGMFQTARTMVFADGMPLHYLLQTRWNGAPRWSLVSADETESVEVIYGPFSAEYSGNAMGGVVNINTKLPTEYEFNAEVSVFSQDFQHMGTDETFTGHREYVSVGDRFDNVSLYLSHNHLENKSQPMSFRYDNTLGTPTVEPVVTGVYKTADDRGTPAIFFGDSGPETAITDLTKFKLGYEMGDWLARFTLAYEERTRATNSPNSYVKDAAGNTVWSGDYNFNGDLFTVRASNLAVSKQERQTLLLGAALEGPLGNGWTLDTNVSHFDVLKDQSLSTKVNPAEATYDGTGKVSDYGDTGWLTLDVKARTDNFLGSKDMNFITGYHYDHYKLKINGYALDNYATGEYTSTVTSTSGGDTIMHAVFAQWGWQFNPRWDLALGARYENWLMMKGVASLTENIADRRETGFSPKISVGYVPGNKWNYRYSLGKALRFPITEELYHNEVKTNSSSIADAKLKPEDGIHQNMMFERQIEKGFMRVNVFSEVVKNVIYNHSVYDAVKGGNVSTFLPIDEVTTHGIEYIVQQKNVFGSDMDARFNITLLDSEITAHSADTSVIGNEMPRLPKIRANLFLTYHVNPDLDTSAGLRYSGDSYGDLDNQDTTTNVYGAIDGYLFLDLKASYKINKSTKVAFGIDNVTDESAFVAHPWPQRTYYIEGSVHF